MGLVKDIQHAKRLAKAHLNHDNIVVSENGDVYANCDLDEVVSQLKKNKEKFFIIKGELTEKKK